METIDALTLINKKLETQSMDSIIQEIKDAEILADKLFGNQFNKIKDTVYTYNDVEYIPSEVNQYGMVRMSRIIYKITNNELMCGGKGLLVHIDELLSNVNTQNI